MIVVNLDVMMARRKISLTELSEKLGMTMANVSNFKNQRARAFRFTTLDALCRILDCQPGDILEYRKDNENEENN
ncbi:MULTISPECIES: helix-turn-helix domain-containing protein [unclassified Sedimentibacter]|uniref:helix-turn-helix domain-containing protein n=1 Tax=unclassified Sedimentibacter TaxID=2649220 RepID=UPI0027E0F330|nr:helix-turn-helix transcriptional regulator [Sedimentibacter sp. MB35-C1]WMJ77078.1 helix-turn-helix transcriptional regulator [Sedimentibacter sp. MB35-C1]